MGDKGTEGILTMLQQSSSTESLEGFMRARGVDPATARVAAERCHAAIMRNSITGTAVGTLAGFYVTASAGGLGAIPGAVLGFVVGNRTTLAFSEECRRVQDAATAIFRLRD